MDSDRRPAGSLKIRPFRDTAKETILGEELMRDLERMVILRVIDQKWIDHLHEMDALREGIGLRADGQKDPLYPIQKEARGIFQEMMTNIRTEVVTTLFHIQVEYQMPMMPGMMDMGVEYEELGPDQDLPQELMNLGALGMLGAGLPMLDMETGDTAGRRKPQSGL